MNETKFRSMKIYDIKTNSAFLILDKPFIADFRLEEDDIFVKSHGKTIGFRYPRWHLVIGNKEFIFDDFTNCRSHRKKRIAKKHGNKVTAWTTDGFLIRYYI